MMIHWNILLAKSIIFFVLVLKGLVEARHVSGQVVNNTLTIAFTFPWSGAWPAGPSIGGAFIVGLEEVRRRNLLPGYDIQWVLKDSACNGMQGIKAVIEIWKDVEDLDVIIGPSCSVFCEPASLLASSWNIPIVSPGCASTGLSDKIIYPTFFRTVSSIKSGSFFPNMIADVFGWQIVGLFALTEPFSSRNAHNVKSILESHGKTVIYFTIGSTFVDDQIDYEDMKKQNLVLRSLKDKVRVIFIMMYGAQVRNLLLSAYDEGMLRGDYVFIAQYSTILTTLKSTYRSELDPILYNGLLSIDLPIHQGLARDKFARKVIEALQHPKFSHVPHLPPTANPDLVGDYAGK